MCALVTDERERGEVAWVYQNTVAKGVGLKKTIKDISEYEAISTSGFQIKIQIKNGKIINAHPINL
ncbi:hypothetical protein DZC78_10125 [Olleya aquimaris]|nr:hypothetical protein DZC78_10125 [Olleya aquimaris]